MKKKTFLLYHKKDDNYNIRSRSHFKVTAIMFAKLIAITRVASFPISGPVPLHSKDVFAEKRYTCYCYVVTIKQLTQKKKKKTVAHDLLGHFII